MIGSDWPVCTRRGGYARTSSAVVRDVSRATSARTSGTPCSAATRGGSGSSRRRRTSHEADDRDRSLQDDSSHRPGWRPRSAMAASAPAARGRRRRARSRRRGTLTIAVIPKGTSHVFWQSIHAGAEKAAQELGVDDHLARPAARGRPRRAGRPRSRASSAAASRASCSRRSTRRRSRSRSPTPQARKIPVVIFDSGLKGDDYVSFVATDNQQGRAAGAASAWPRLLQRQGQGRAAALRRRVRQHQQARGRASSRR